jgi:hypothetical protein
MLLPRKTGSTLTFAYKITRGRFTERESHCFEEIGLLVFLLAPRR